VVRARDYVEWRARSYGQGPLGLLKRRDFSEASSGIRLPTKRRVEIKHHTDLILVWKYSCKDNQSI
jgi:hypothetical protein